MIVDTIMRLLARGTSVEALPRARDEQGSGRSQAISGASLRHDVADRRADTVGDRVAGEVVEAPRLGGLRPVADSEPLEGVLDLPQARPVEVLETDVVGNADILPELILRVAHERPVDGFRSQCLGAQPG